LKNEGDIVEVTVRVSLDNELYNDGKMEPWHAY
jgi:hypothetical protein